MEDAPVLLDRVAVTETLVRAEEAKARQISAVPFCVFVLTTSAQVNPAPATLLTVIAPDGTPSVETKASNNSLPDAVENGTVVTVLAVPWSCDALASMAMAGGGGT